MAASIRASCPYWYDQIVGAYPVREHQLDITEATSVKRPRHTELVASSLSSRHYGDTTTDLSVVYWSVTPVTLTN